MRVGAVGLFVSNKVLMLKKQSQDYAKELEVFTGRIGRLRNLLAVVKTNQKLDFVQRQGLDGHTLSETAAAVYAAGTFRDAVKYIGLGVARRCSQVGEENIVDFLSELVLVLQVAFPLTVQKLGEIEGGAEDEEEEEEEEYAYDEKLGRMVLVENAARRGRGGGESVDEDEELQQILSWLKLDLGQIRALAGKGKGLLEARFDWPTEEPEEGEAVESSTDTVKFFSPWKINSRRNANRLTSMPVNYTDLFVLLPDHEGSTAVCLNCGACIDAKGKGLCGKHVVECGAGCGIFFLVQQCKVIAMSEQRAIYLPGIFVDENHETPQFKGRPLRLDIGRMMELKNMYATHRIREKVSGDRGMLASIIRLGYY